MRTYNFDAIIPRRGTDSLKWDTSEDPNVLPMWIADMDFRTLPEIELALLKRVRHGIFGYSRTPTAFHDAIIGWYRERHAYKIYKEWLLPTAGMSATLSSIIRALTNKSDRIIVQPPVYDHFFTLIENCGRGIVTNNLINTDGSYEMDFDDLELKAADPQTKLLLFCNPQNPIGRVWKRHDLEKIASICSRHNITVVSDEIHADLVYTGHLHIPFASVAEHYSLTALTCGSPCKTFNLAALPVSHVICPDKEIKKRIETILDMQGTNSIDPFAIEALIAAYTKGEKWLEELKDYLYGNYLSLKDFFESYLPEIEITSLESTYLVWLNCKRWDKTSVGLSNSLIGNAGLWVNPGSRYGVAGEGFLRLNIACPRSCLQSGLERLKTGALKLEWTIREWKSNRLS